MSQSLVIIVTLWETYWKILWVEIVRKVTCMTRISSSLRYLYWKILCIKLSEKFHICRLLYQKVNNSSADINVSHNHVIFTSARKLLKWQLVWQNILIIVAVSPLKNVSKLFLIFCTFWKGDQGYISVIRCRRKVQTSAGYCLYRL